MVVTAWCPRWRRCRGHASARKPINCRRHSRRRSGNVDRSGQRGCRRQAHLHHIPDTFAQDAAAAGTRRCPPRPSATRTASVPTPIRRDYLACVNHSATGVCSPLIFISSFTDDYHGVSVAPKRELGDFCQKAIMNNVTVWAPGCFLQSSIASSPTQCDCALFASHY